MTDWSRSNWMQTYTGKQFFPFAPTIDSIDIVDIAQALANTCRYGGHTKQFYSVAQHSVLMAEKAPAHLARRTLMHDAAEAYTGDHIRPIKKHPEMSALEWLEETVERAICAALDLPFPIMTPEIKRLDNRILLDERDQVMTLPPADWEIGGEPLGVTIKYWSPETAKWKFLDAWERYSSTAWRAAEEIAA